MRMYYNYKDEMNMINIKSEQTFKSPINYSKKKLTKAFRTSIKRRYQKDFNEYMDDMNKKVNKCAFCGRNAWFILSFDIIPYKNSYMIEDFHIIENDILYCRGRFGECSGKNYNANSKYFVSKVNNVTLDEALEIIHDRNPTPFYSKNHDTYDEYIISQTRDIDFFGSEERYVEYKETLKHSHTIEYNIEKYGEKKGKEIYERKCKLKDSMSLNFHLNKYENEEDAIFHYNKRKKEVQITLENYIRRYGETKGKIKYETHLKNKVPLGMVSKESVEMMEEILDENKYDIDLLYGDDEYKIKKPKGYYYYYDFTSVKYKFIIEYHGKIWHPNKDIYTKKEWDEWKHPFNENIKASDIYNKDIEKEKLAKDNGFDILVVWDFDKYKKEKIQKFIENKIK